MPAVAIEPVEQILVHLLQRIAVFLTAELVVLFLQGEFRLFISLVDAQLFLGVVASRLDLGLVDFFQSRHGGIVLLEIFLCVVAEILVLDFLQLGLVFLFGFFGFLATPLHLLHEPLAIVRLGLQPLLGTFLGQINESAQVGELDVLHLHVVGLLGELAVEVVLLRFRFQFLITALLL